MAHGVPTDEETVAKFRAHYLYSGNASESARAVDLPESTGRDLAREISREPGFVEARRELRAQALEELVAMRMRMAQTALKRFEEDLPMPTEVGEGGTVTIIDKRPDYGKLVTEAEKNAHNLAKLEREAAEGSSSSQGHEVRIRVFGPDGITALAGDDEKKPSVG